MSSSESSSESSGGDIKFLVSQEYLTNPNACDYDTIDVPFSNTTGRLIASVSFANNVEGAFSAAASSTEYPYTIISWDQNKLTLKAAMDVGIAGIALASAGVEFKDDDGQSIATAFLGLEVQQTLKSALKIAGEKITFDLSESLGAKTGEWALGYPFDDQTLAESTITGVVSAKLSSEADTIMASMYASFTEKVDALPSAQDVSIKLGGAASYTVISADVTSTTVLSVNGNSAITWTPTSTNAAQVVFGLGMTFGNINVGDRKLDGNIWNWGVKFESLNNVGGGTNSIKTENRIIINGEITF